ncbi:B-cell receptor-associated protein 31-like-domain-containing protein [Gaertneriomyces semiglobifer]|nr:B-cell receptor-associated protein 31-like-domain-containing protein [Gaertneriomyces semiglobifer]
MSLFNRLVYYFLWVELAAFLLTLIPLGFIPLRRRKAFMHAVSNLAKKDAALWIGRLVLFVVGGVFIDTIQRLYRMETEYKEDPKQMSDTVSAELQHKVRLFYTQRNLYLSLFSMFMVLVLYRRLVYQEELAEQRKIVNDLNKQLSDSPPSLGLDGTTLASDSTSARSNIAASVGTKSGAPRQRKGADLQVES